VEGDWGRRPVPVSARRAKSDRRCGKMSRGMSTASRLEQSGPALVFQPLHLAIEGVLIA